MNNSIDFNTVAKGKKRRTPPYSIRFTEKEKAILTREANGRPWSDLIRERVFSTDHTFRQRGRKDMDQRKAVSAALGQLGQSRLASNMNQIAKALNTGSMPITPDLHAELRQACDHIRAMREALIESLGVKTQS